MKISRIVLIVSLFASTTGRAQTLVVHAGHLINPADGSSAANQTVVIEDGKIMAIATNPKVTGGRVRYRSVMPKSKWVRTFFRPPPSAAGRADEF